MGSGWRKMAAGLALIGGLTACSEPVSPVPIPPLRPPVPVPDAAQAASEPSARSLSLRRYYARLQNDLLARGLLRTDGGGPDTPYDAATLVRDFEAIAFYDEYSPGSGLLQGGGEAGLLRRWPGPVRVSARFGANVPDSQRAGDGDALRAFTARLARITGHPISFDTAGTGNMIVMFMGEDDTAQMIGELRRSVPGIPDKTIDIFARLPRSIHCLIVAFSSPDAPQDYIRAVALVRAEHPDLIRLSCIHEEVAQGLGLANDSPDARPSIFNDDDEFALLTSHDEMLLAMLYDPRLRPGLSVAQARPVLRILAREALGAQL